LPEAFLYEVVHIPVQLFEDIFIQELHQRTGLLLNSIRFGEDKRQDEWWSQSSYAFLNDYRALFVDLSQDSALFIDSWGSSDSRVLLEVFNRTLLSVPGITSLQITVDGERGFWGSHFSFNGINIEVSE